MFKKYVKYVAERYETNENVFGFQLMNEPRVADGNEEVFERWCEEIFNCKLPHISYLILRPIDTTKQI